jgi:hypothetical protein
MTLNTCSTADHRVDFRKTPLDTRVFSHEPLSQFHVCHLTRTSFSFVCEIYQCLPLGKLPNSCLLDTTALWKHTYNVTRLFLGFN